MRFQFASAILMTCAVISFSCSDRSAPVGYPAFDSVMLAHPGFNGVVLVADEGTPIYHRAFGQRDPVAELPADTSAIFELASVSKTFTSVVVLQQIAAGRMALEDSVRRFLPDFPYAGISIRHLLTHTSGLPDYQAVMDLHWDKSKVAGNEECLEYLARFRPLPLFAPGEKYAYSNTGYLVLASIVEKLTGKPFAQLLDSCVLQPSGMRTAALRSAADKRSTPHFVYGFMYDSVRGRWSPADSFPSSNYTIWLAKRRGPGRISASSLDLLRYSKALEAGKLLLKDLLDQAYTPAHLNDGTETEYGLGWEIHSITGHSLIVGHSGDNPGYKTLFLRDLTRNRTVVLLSNNAYPRLKEISAVLLR